MKKRIVSLLLAVVLVAGCLPLSASASFGNVWASGFDGVKAIGQTCHGWEYNYQKSYWGQYGGHNCTNYIAYMLSNKGVGNFLGGGNANSWKGWAQNAGYTVNTTPAVGAIAWWGNGDGHVAFVEEVNWEQEYIVVSEDNWGGDYEWSFLGFHDRGWPPAFLHISDGPAFDVAPAPSNITLDTPWASDVWETNAVIHSVIRNGGASVNCSNFGFQIWEKSSGKLLCTHKEEIPSQYQSYDHIDIWLNLYDELGLALERGREYICQFSTEKGGKTYQSEKMTFQTKGTAAPSVATLSISKKEVLVGEDITFICTSDAATGYTLGINKGGARVLTQEVPSGSFTTSFQESGEYSAYVSAYNDGGMLNSSPVYFTVKAADGGTPLDPTPENDFIDVPNGAYFTDAVNWAVDNGITAGTTKITFSPNAVCTRGQAVTFLWRAAGSPKPTLSSTEFTDVPAGKFYSEAVLWAVEQGITGGVSATRFAPDEKCTRAQIVSFLYRMEGSPAVSSVSPFLDVPPSLYYSNAVAWAVERGITAGTSATLFSPHNDCSRGQIVTFLYRDFK